MTLKTLIWRSDADGHIQSMTGVTRNDEESGLTHGGRPQALSLPFLKEYVGPAERRGLERGGLEDSLGCSS